VTKIVRRLETEFGLPLFERGGRGLALTSAGHALHRRAVDMAALASATRHDMAAEKAAQGGTVRLGVVPALLGIVATPVIADLLERHASLRILVSVNLSGELARMVQDGQLDLALCYGVDSLPPDLTRTRVGRQRYRLVARQGHGLAGHAPSLEELASVAWLLPTPDVAHRQGIELAFAEAGLGPLDVRVETDTSALWFTPLLRRSNLVAVLAEQLLHAAVQDGIAALDVDFPALTGDIALYHRRQTPSTGILAGLKHGLAQRVRHCFTQGP
jgi:DNA-binding transcriptional LysR family regulator